MPDPSVADIFAGFDPSEGIAPANPADAFQGFDPTPEHSPEADFARRQLRDAGARLDKEALSQGEPIVSQRGDFAPPLTGSRNYLSSWSQGLLDLGDNSFSPNQEEDMAARLYAQFEASHPNAAQVIRDPKSKEFFGVDPKLALLAHLRSVARLKHTQPTPRETLDAGDDATRDWVAAAKAGTITDAFSKPVSLPDLEAALPAARDIYAKLQAKGRGFAVAGATTGAPGLSGGTLDPVERVAFEALGGSRWLQFVQDHQPFYVGRSRKERLFGLPRQPDEAPPTISTFGKSSIPTEAPFAVEDLERSSSFVRTLLAAGQQIGVRDAIQTAAEFNAYGSQFPGNLIGAAAHRGLAKVSGDYGQPEEYFANTDSLDRLADRAGSVFTNTISAGVDGFGKIGVPAVNLLTLGTLEGALTGVKTAQEAVAGISTGLYSFTENLIDGKYDATVDKDVFNRATDAMTAGISRRLAVMAPRGHDDRKISDTVDFIESAFPDMTDDGRRELRKHYLGGAQAITSFMRRANEGALGHPVEFVANTLRLDSPYAQNVAAEVIGPGLDSPEGWFFTITGARQLFNSAFRAGRIPRRTDPKLKAAFTDFEAVLGEAGHVSPAGPSLRAGLVDSISEKLQGFTDRGAQQGFIRRMHEVFKQYDSPITPENAATIKTSLERYQAAAADLQNTKLSESSRAAFRELAEHVSDFDPIDIQFLMTGQDSFIGKSGSLAALDRAKRWYEDQSRSTSALPLPRQIDRPPDKVLKVQSGLMEFAERNKEFAGRQERFLSVTDRLVHNLAAEVTELDSWAKKHADVKGAVSSSYNAYLQGLVKRNLDLETHGGSVPKPNPLSAEPATQRLATALSDGGKRLEALLTDRDLATPERAALSESLKKVTPEERPALIAEWARNEFAARTTPTTLDVEPLGSPKQELAAGLLKKIDEAAAAGEKPKLTAAESRWLAEHGARLGEKPLSDFHNTITQALEDTATKAIADRDRSLTLAEEVRKLQDEARKASPEKGFKLKISKKLRTEMEDALARADFPTDRKFIALAADATDNELSALQAFRESLDDFSRDHHGITHDVLRLSSLDLAVFAKSAPHVIYHELQKADRAAVGYHHSRNAQAKMLEKTFHRKVPPAEAAAIFNDLATGKPVTNEAIELMRRQRLEMLGEFVNTQKISAEQYTSIVGRPYQHYMYDRSTRAEVGATPSAQPRSAGRKPLTVDPGALRHRIPEKGNHYVEWEDKTGQRHTQDGFDTPEAAEAWAQANVPIDAPTAVLNTWSYIDRQIHGLIEDPAIAHLDMSQQMSLAIHNDRISKFWATTPDVKRLSDVEDMAARGEGAFSSDPERRTFTTADGKQQFQLWKDPKNPWLDGRYVSPGVAEWLGEFKSGYGIVNEYVAAAQETAPIQGKYMDPGWKALKLAGNLAHYALKGLSNSLTFTKVALSIPTVRSNWFSNILTGNFAHLNLFNPRTLAYAIGDALESFRTRLYSPGGFMDDRAWKLLAENDLVRFGNENDWHKAKGANHSRAVETELDQHWRPAKSILARIEATEAHLARGVDADTAAKLETRLADLKVQLEKASSGLARGFFRSLLKYSTNVVNDVAAGIFKGEGKTNSAVWNTMYPEVTGDRLIKYLALKNLLRRGVPEDEALSIIADNMQQLHRVPAAVRKVSRTTGGAMFYSFVHDQGRIFGNVLRQQPEKVARMLMMLYGWNAAAITASGNSVEDHLEASALARGVRRDMFSDLQSMLSGIKMPGGLGAASAPGTVYDLSLGPGLWDFFAPLSKVGRNFSAILKGKSDNSLLHGFIDGATGLASKGGLADIATFLISVAATKEDERGQPISDAGDLLSAMGRQFLAIRGLPGSAEYATMSRAWRGEEANLQTGRKISFKEALLKWSFKAAEELDTPSRFRSALLQEIEDRGLTGTFRLEEHQDNLLSTQVDRRARLPNGKIDTKFALEIARELHAANPPTRRGVGGEEVVSSFDPKDAYKKISDLGKPKLLRLYSRQNLPLQVSAYAKWMSVDGLGRARDEDWYKKVRKVLFDKVTGTHPFSISTVREVNVRIEEALNSGRLPDYAANDLAALKALLSRKISKGASN